MAERLRDLGHIAEAIAMGERGLKLAGLQVRLGEWQVYLHKVKEQYRRRPALQAQLQRL